MERVLATSVYGVCLCDRGLKIALRKPSKHTEACEAKVVVGRSNLS